MNLSLIFFSIGIVLMIMFFCLIKKPKILGSNSVRILLCILQFILLGFCLILLMRFSPDKEGIVDLISAMFTTLVLLFTSGKDTIGGSGSDMPDAGRGNSSSVGGASAGPSGSGRNFWDVVTTANPEETSNPNAPSDVEDANPSPPSPPQGGEGAGPSELGTSPNPFGASEEGSSKLDKGKRKATEQEVLEQEEEEERKRLRVDPPWDYQKAQEEMRREAELEKQYNFQKEHEYELGSDAKRESADEQFARALQEEYDLEFASFLEMMQKNKEVPTEEVEPTKGVESTEEDVKQEDVKHKDVKQEKLTEEERQESKQDVSLSPYSCYSSINSEDEGERLEKKLEILEVEKSLPRKPPKK